MVSLRFIQILVPVSFVCILFGQVCLSQDPCPSRHRCLDRRQCRPSVMKLIRGRPVNCGYSSSGSLRICCPDGSRQPVVTTPKPKPAEPDEPIVRNDAIPLNPNPGNCGRAFGLPSKEGFVLGGVDAEQGAWPWMVAIMMANERGIQSPLCTGFLIDRKHVISAAHCFEKKQTSLYSTRIGNVDLTQGDVYPVQHIALHKGYKNGQFYNDIALLTLSKDVDIPNFSPICLPSSHSATNLTGRGTTVVGWGSTTPRGAMSLTLKQLSAMPVVPNELCDGKYRGSLSAFRRQFPHGIYSKMICAGFLEEEGKDGCGGDSGGPLMMRENDMWYAVGVVSFGYKCGRMGFPGGYTKVSEFVDWINSHKRISYPNDYSNAVNSCERGSRCIPRNACRSRDVLLRDGRAVTCGYTSTWRRQVCCGRTRVTPPPPVIPTPAVPIPQPPILRVPQPSIPAPSNVIECGRASGSPLLEGFIIGGEDAVLGAWPWMVAITMANRNGRQNPWCTGFMIDRRHVLSAAHCFDRRRSSLYRARIGHVNQTLADEYTITRIMIPRGYQVGRFYDDIALLTLSRNVDVPNFSPICLPWSRDFINITGRGTTVAGWGATRSGGPVSLILKQLSAMPVVENDVCNRIFLQRLPNFRNQFPRGISPGFVCAGFLDEEGKDSCGGDSGGPLMFQYQDRWYAVGVVSFGYLCGEEGYPGGYTRVSEYLDWINENLND